MKKRPAVSPMRVAAVPPTEVTTQRASSTIAVPGLEIASEIHAGMKLLTPRNPPAARTAVNSTPSTPSVSV